MVKGWVVEGACLIWLGVIEDLWMSGSVNTSRDAFVGKMMSSIQRLISKKWYIQK